MFPDEAAEEGGVGEVEFYGNFLDGLLCLRQSLGDNVDHVVLNPICGGLAAHLAHRHGEVFGRDVQHVGKGLDRAYAAVGTATTCTNANPAASREE